MKKLITMSFAVVMGLTEALGAEGKQVVFYGDSITESGRYLTHLQLFSALRNPGQGIEAYNVGKSGDTAPGGLARWEGDGAPLKPDSIFVMFGMNDCQVGTQKTAAPTNAADAARREKLASDYRDNMGRLLDRLSKDCADITLMTPTPYDQYGPQKVAPSLGANEPMLANFAAIVREIAEARKLKTIELHRPMTELVKAHPEACIVGGDRVHPSDVGQYLMACLCWEGMGNDGCVGETKVDAGGKQAFAFDYAPKSLPMPVTGLYRTVERYWPVTERLNREMLMVAGLPDGHYSLKADGREIGVFSADLLGKGVNLALLDTPNRRIADGAEKDRARLHQIASDFRSVIYLQQWMKNAKIDLADRAATKRYFEEQREAAKKLSWGGWHVHCVNKMEELLPKWDALKAEEKAIRQRLRALRPMAVKMSVSAVKATSLVGGFGGSLELPEEGILLRPTMHTASWKPGEAVEDGFVSPAKNGHDFYFQCPDAEDERIVGHAAFSESEIGGLKAEWKVTIPKGRKGDRIWIFGALDLPQYEGATFSAGGEKAVLSSKAKLGEAINRKARDFTLTKADGRVAIRMEFADEIQVTLMKMRDWGVIRYGVRIGFSGDGSSRVLAARVSSGEALAFREEGPVEIRAGAEWIPYRAEADVIDGSALDFTNFRGTDMPAGRHGWVVARNGHFEFEDMPGVPQRFYGINICSSANVPEEDVAKRFAAKLRKLGYNAVRFHHHEAKLVKADAEKGSTELDPAAMRKFDALVAACIENGLYLTTDLFVSRAPISYRSLGIDMPGNCEMNEYKFLVATHEGAYANFIRYAKNFLGHVNEFTGRRYADEPALSLISFVNEGNLAGTKWAAGKHKLLKDDSKDATAVLERKFARRVTKFLREEMKCKALFTNMNNFFWDDDPAGEGVRANEYDYADDHFYVDHPRFIAKSWRLPSSCPNTNPLVGIDMGAQRLASTRPLNMPFTITEYNFSAPGKFRGVGGILTGALGARQDWGGLLRFAWSHDKHGLVDVKRLGYFDMSGDPLGLAAERASICLFLRRDLATAQGTCAFVIPTEKSLNLKQNPGTISPYWDCAWAAWHTKIGTFVTNQVPTGIEVLATYPEWPDAKALEALKRRPTGGVTIDSKRGSLVIDTERTAGGFAENGRIVAGPFVADVGEVPTTIWASSLDGQAIATSGRILLTHLTDVQNTGIRYADSGKRILLGWGDLPHLMRAGKAKVSLGVSGEGWKVHALSSAGKRIREVASNVSGGRLEFVADIAFDPSNATYLYELERKASGTADFNVRDYGAKGDGITKDTAAIRAAVEACSRVGGRVVVPSGTFLTGPIRLASKVELHLEKGAVLMASPDIADYPEWQSVRHIAYPKALPRMRNASFIFADEAQDIAFTGEGAIDCNGERFVKPKTDPNWTGWQFERAVPMTNSLPRVVFLVGCSNVVLRGITIRNPPAGWSTWFHDCDNVLIEDAKVKADVRYPNNDGLHVNSCRNVIIRNCDLETGDDSIIVRANNRALAENRVCENVVVSNCTLRSWSSGIRIAWANDGTIRNCLFKDLKMRDTTVGVAMCLPLVGGWNTYDYGREPTRFENLLFEDIDMDGIYARPILATIAPVKDGTLVDGFYNVVFRNVRSRGLEGPLFVGRPENPIRGISLQNCDFKVVGDDELPDYRRHGAACWDRRHGIKNANYIPER